LEVLLECSDVHCGEFCIANRTLPDGNSDYIINNCMIAGQNYSIYVRLCSGDTPAPTTIAEAWHDSRHEVFDCVEEHINITSPTIATIDTSEDIDEATIQCLAACQASDVCNYWTVDIRNHTCALKLNNTGKVESEYTFSGERSCAVATVEEFGCFFINCDVELNISSTCGDQFTFEMLVGDYNDAIEYVDVYINGIISSRCAMKGFYDGDDPSWVTCGIYDIPRGETVMLLFDSTEAHPFIIYDNSL
jgi:hypothetical protein